MMLDGSTLISVVLDDKSLVGSDRSVDRNAERRAQYADRLARGACTRCDKRQSLDGDQYCKACGKRVRRNQARSKARQREARRNKKRCVDCGLKSERYRCKRCEIRQGRAGSDRGVDRRVVQGLDERQETDGYKRTRYHGRRKGAPSRAERDAFDLKIAAKACSRALDGCLAAGAARAQLSSQELALAELAWLEHVAMLGRIADELLERNNYARRHRKAAPSGRREKMP